MTQGSTKLSSNYTVAQLSATSKAVTQPNLPSTKEQLENMKLLADNLEYLSKKIGPFSIMSGFRTTELQNLLKAEGSPTASGKSYHELGLAVDIYPKTMSLAEYFGRMLADNEIKRRFIELSIKPTQNTLHLAVKPLGDTRPSKILSLTPSGIYKSLSLEEIAKYAKPYAQGVSMAALALIGIASFFVVKRLA